MKPVLLILCCLAAPFVAFSQDSDSTNTKKWEFGADLNAYFMKDDVSLLPVVRADNNWLHLEARYNYEDVNTFSAWGGYNFSGGKKLEYLVTPMAGVVIGESNGFAPGLEMTFTFHSFELYSESEYFIDTETSENNFLYTWTDLSWSPTDWFWVGISGQRTRVYDTGLEIQRGILAGGSIGAFEINTYFYNPASDDFYFIAAISADF